MPRLRYEEKEERKLPNINNRLTNMDGKGKQMLTRDDTIHYKKKQSHPYIAFSYHVS